MSSASIMTDSGELVWSAPMGTYSNLRVQTVDNETALTYWNGSGSANVASQGHGYGAVYILDTSYNVKYVVCPKLGLTTVNNTYYECQGDIHESYMTERNTLIVSAYNATQTDLTAVGGASDGWVFDSLFFELDIRTSKVLFSWSALEHVNITDSKLPLVSPMGTSGTAQMPWDFFHINSIQSVGDGYLVNSRMFFTSYMLDNHGAIQWEFEVRYPHFRLATCRANQSQGSNGGDFKLPRPNIFVSSHHSSSP
jgi:hypothetical protein